MTFPAWREHIQYLEGEVASWRGLYEEAVDMVEELAAQGMFSDRDGEYIDCAISSYEAAAEFLARARPGRWEVTPRGMREKKDGSAAEILSLLGDIE